MFGITFVVLAVLRLALPSLLFHYVDGRLSALDGYRASITDLDLNLWRGAYEIEGLSMHKVDGEAEAPFLDVAKVDLSVSWSALLRGRLVGEAVLYRPVQYVVTAPREVGTQTGAEADWWSALQDLFPFVVERIVVRDGSFHFVDRRREPEVDLWIDDVYVDGRNLTNRMDLAGETPSTIELAGRPFGNAELVALLEYAPFATPTRFELDAVARGIQFRQLNDFAVHYFGADAEDGTLQLDLEIAAEDGVAEGYAKLLVEGLQIASFDEIDDPAAALQFVWEALLGLAAEVVENQPHSRLAVRIPLRGELDDLKVGTWTAIGTLLGNAYVAAIEPGLEHSVDTDDARGEAAAGDERDP